MQEKEVPDNTVFWSIVGVISVFVVVLAAVMIVRTGVTGKIVLQWPEPSRPFSVNPLACTDVQPCGSDVSFVCCAEQPLPGTGRKCTAPVRGYISEAPMCPDAMPYRCTCPEKHQYRQSWPIPSR